MLINILTLILIKSEIKTLLFIIRQIINNENQNISSLLFKLCSTNLMIAFNQAICNNPDNDEILSTFSKILPKIPETILETHLDSLLKILNNILKPKFQPIEEHCRIVVRVGEIKKEEAEKFLNNLPQNPLLSFLSKSIESQSPNSFYRCAILFSKTEDIQIIMKFVCSSYQYFQLQEFSLLILRKFEINESISFFELQMLSIVLKSLVQLSQVTLEISQKVEAMIFKLINSKNQEILNLVYSLIMNFKF
jgi:hypothetical protein